MRLEKRREDNNITIRLLNDFFGLNKMTGTIIDRYIIKGKNIVTIIVTIKNPRKPDSNLVRDRKENNML